MMTEGIRLGLALDVWASPDVRLPLDRVMQAERLGYDSVWSSEAYGADALTPLAYIAALTKRIRLATSVVQLSARTPAATAMAFATIDALAGPGRVVAGLGLSGPQVVEGWYGQPWAQPLARTRDAIAIMRQVFRREGPVAHDGRAIELPYRGPGATGEGKALKPMLHTRSSIPVFLAAGGPANVALAAEIADGWLPMGFAPDNAPTFDAALADGAARGGRSPADVDTWASVTVRITDDVPATIAAAKPRIALYVGGMGSRRHNFHRDAMARRGYGDVANRIQELFLAGRRDEMAAEVPDEYVDDSGLYGSPVRIARRWKAWAGCRLTGVIVHAGQPEAVDLLASLEDVSLVRTAE
jgi:F420-dependent oxidoreductase-like protein